MCVCFEKLKISLSIQDIECTGGWQVILGI